MANWLLKRSATSTRMEQVDDAKLRRMVLSAAISGLEPVRPDLSGSGEWVPIHTLPLFREVLGLPSDQAALDVATQRRKRSMAIGFGVMGTLATMGFLGGIVSSASRDGGAGAGAFVVGAVAIVMMAGAVAAFLRTGQRAAKAMSGGANKSGDTIKAPAAQPNRVDEVERSLAALEKALESAPESIRSAIPVASLRESARRLKKNRELLASLPADDARAALTVELESAKTRRAAATDSKTTDALADQIRGIEAHLRSIDDASAAIAETEARARALLHEAEALRVDVLRAGTDSTVDDELLERLHAIRRELEAESAIEEQLSRSAPAQRAMGPVAAK